MTSNPSETNASTKNLDDFEITVILHTRTNNHEKQFLFTEKLDDIPDENGFHNLNFLLDQNHTTIYAETNDDDKDFDISKVNKITINWALSDSIYLNNLAAEPLIAIVTGDPNLRRYPWINVNEDNSPTEADIQKKHNGKPTIKNSSTSHEIIWTFPTPKNFNSIKRIRFSSDTFIKPNLVLCSDVDELYEIPIDLFESNQNDSEWKCYFCDLEHATSSSKETIDFSKIKSMTLGNLPIDDFYLSEILGEVNFENDFIILGSSLTKQKPGQMYTQGALYEKMYFDTYLNQVDYPNPKNFLLDSNFNKNESSTKKATFLVYADVWQRGITYVEDPNIREIALGGPDTTTRIKTICQTKLLEIPSGNDIGKNIENEENKLKNIAKENLPGLLSTFTSSQNTDIDNLNNSLYLIQIHDGGNGKDGFTTFKWSSDNAGTFFPLKTIKSFSLSFSTVGRRLDNLFQIGDIIEILDDSIELSDNPRGEIRRIINIDLDNNVLSWASSDSDDPTNINYLHNPVVLPHVKSFHPKLIKWDGIKKLQINDENSTDIITLISDKSQKTTLSQSDHGIKIKFHSGYFQTGDYWNFTVRSANDSVEKLRYRPPHGPKHNYVMLALIEKESSSPIVLLDDLRKKTNTRIGNANANPPQAESFSNLTSIFRIGAHQSGQISTNQPYIHFGQDYSLDKGLKTKIQFEHIYDRIPLLSYSLKTKYGENVVHKIEDIESNSGCEGFFITAEEDSVFNWVSVGKSSSYEKESITKITKSMCKLIFGDKATKILTTGDENTDDYWCKKIKKMLK